jgi:V8-like Glu-specific endopeptidase
MGQGDLTSDAPPDQPDSTITARRRARLLTWLTRRRLRRLSAMLLPAGVLSASLLNPAALAAGQSASRRGLPFNGSPAVGALFTVVHGRLRTHFCTASVVHSKAQNLLITAAHCVYGKRRAASGGIAFAPAYHDGRFPRGVWPVTAVYVDRAWRLRRSPDNDVAFLVAGRPGDRIERHTGAEVLGIHQAPQLVTVIGYPDGAGQPVSCAARARAFRRDWHQMVWDCGGYTNGTSGGPFLARVSARTGDGTVIGVIGGWELGGDLPGVSYSPRFFTNIARLYQRAASGGPAS